jgi:predicted DNA-binding transcriptional regulator YafY
MPGQTIVFRYRNWKGDVSDRTARVISLTYGATEWHREPQWLLKAFDIEKNAERLFALRDMVPAE